METKNFKQTFVLFLIKFWLLFTVGSIHAQLPYVSPDDPLVEKNLDEWQDMKFGFMMHWGPYSQWGVVESWSICSEDVPWFRREMDNYVEYIKAYTQLKSTFNPTRFDPQQWADAAKEAGMKYVVFTTKHHDGFSMFNTQLTDYCVTDPGCPFHLNTKANITNEVFNAFREQGFKVGAYFSKPDWHSPYYWWPYFATPDRHVNYNPEKYPERWEKFKDFTYGQIKELMTGYGKVDILWLDGGWVSPRPKIKKHPWNQDIDMPRIAKMARNHQPGLIIVDRSGGKYENYTTPEQHIPTEAIAHPWETCMTLGDSWSYNPNDHCKTSRQIIHLLSDIVAKGGNYLLNVGPKPDGTLPQEALDLMKEIGVWLKINGEAIYYTRPIAPYKEGNICFTQKPDKSITAIYLAKENETTPPKNIIISSFTPQKGSKVYLLGYKPPLKWKKEGTGFMVTLPDQVLKHPPCKDAWVIKIRKVSKP